MYGLSLSLSFSAVCHCFKVIVNVMVNWQEDFPHNAHHREVAISVSNYTIKHGDTGLVIVGGRMEIQPHVCTLCLSTALR